MNAGVNGPVTVPVDIVISVDEQDGHWLGCLVALVDSLVLCWRRPEALAITVVYRGALGVGVKTLMDGTPRLTCRYLSLEEDLGIVADTESSAPLWRRLLGLGYARHTTSTFYLLVDSQSFCVRSFDYGVLLPGGRARSQWEDFGKHSGPARTARILCGNAPLPNLGLSVHPVIYSAKLASAAVVLLEKLHGMPVIEFLISLCEKKIEWTDNSIYTLANWLRLSEFHLHPDDEQNDISARGLHTDIDIWSDDPGPAWSPKRWTAVTQHGLFVNAHVASEIRSVLLDRTYAALSNFV